MPLKTGLFKCVQKTPPEYSESRMKERCFPVFAIITTGGKQYKVTEGDIIFIEKLGAEEGSEVVFEQVNALSNDNGFVAGTPTVEGASVTAKVLAQGKNKKIYVMKYKAKKNEKKKIGHRQPYTKVQIEKIVG